MANKILYIQQNENVANEFRGRFSEADFELIVAKSGEEALSLLEDDKDVLLLLVDINIPDMRLRSLVERVKKVAPQILLNVCIDVVDSLLITKLANRYDIHKIYVAPWDIDEIVDEVKDSIEVALIDREINLKEVKIEQEKKEIEESIATLSKALKKQKNSYSKLLDIYTCFTKGLSEDYVGQDDYERRGKFAKDVFMTNLKMQTTGSFDIDRFEEDIEADLNELKRRFNGIEIKNIISCLFGGITKTSAENIRFSVWAICRYYAEFYKNFEYEVVSHFLTTTIAEFRCSIVIKDDLSEKEQENIRKERAKYKDFVLGMLARLGQESGREENEGKITIVFSFPVEAN